MRWVPRSSLPRWIPALVASGVLVACNVFNPSGSGSYPDGADVEIDLGQRALRDRSYQGAWEHFARALALDSSKSLAYHGLAKSGMGRDGFALSDLVILADSVSDASDDRRLDVLLGTDRAKLDRIYRSLMRAASVYRLLSSRDSAGRTDGVFPARLVARELDAILAARIHFRLIDADGDTAISASEMGLLKLFRLGPGGLRLDQALLLGSGAVDSVTGAVADSTIEMLNGVMLNVAEIVRDSQGLDRIRSTIAVDSSSATSQLSGNSLDFLERLGTSTSFFLVNDSLDNDGDGCWNEEIHGDSLDNDGDSLRDEDARIGYQSSRGRVDGATALVSPPDGHLNDRVEIVASGIRRIAGDDDASSLRWAGTSGMLEPYRNLSWVRWDDPAVGNDSIWTRVLRENGYDAESVRASEDYEKIRTLAIVEVRKKVMAEADPVRRKALGLKTVGGCWIHAR